MNPTAVPTTGPPTRPDTVMTKVLVLAMAAWVEIVGKKLAGSKAGKGMPTFWTRNGHQVGYAAKRNYHLYFFK